MLGICDRQCRLCFSVALWNEKDPILKERLFGLTGEWKFNFKILLVQLNFRISFSCNDRYLVIVQLLFMHALLLSVSTYCEVICV